MENELLDDVVIEQADNNVKNKRQEFPDIVRRELMLRANLRCCNPKCRRLLAAVDKKTNEFIILGEGAHIYPATVGGPRYDENHSNPDEIKSQTNGLWLCPVCHALIDKKVCVSNYPASKLQEWKKQSETEYSDCLEDPILDFKMKFNDDYFRNTNFDYEALSDLQKVVFYYCIFNETNFELIISSTNDNQMSDFITSYENLRNWYISTENEKIRETLDFELKYVKTYDCYSDSKYDWQNMLDKFIKEFSGNKNLCSISHCDSNTITVSFELIKKAAFNNDEKKLEEFCLLFE